MKVDRYEKNSATNVDITRSLFHWQTHAKIVVEDGYCYNFLWKLNKRYLCPSKTFLRNNVFKQSYTVSKAMLSAYIQEHTDGIWVSSDIWWSKYGRFNVMSLTAYHIDSNFIYRTFPIAKRNFKGKHTHEQVFNHHCFVMYDCIIANQILFVFTRGLVPCRKVVF